MKLIIFEQSGFEKKIEIAKAVTRIGSAPACDIQLHSPLVSPFHLQILYTQDTPDRCKLVNLASETAILSSGGQEIPLAAYATAEAIAGDELRLTGFHLRFELPVTSGTLISSQKISASVALPEPILRPNATLLGRILLKNEGERNACQFQIEIGGLPEDCYRVDPVPLLYEGAQEEVNIRFFHRKIYPPAGFQSVMISVTAPESYPGEQVSLQQGLYISPVLEQGLQILDDMPAPQAIAPGSPTNLPQENLPEETSTEDTPEQAPPAPEPTFQPSSTQARQESRPAEDKTAQQVSAPLPAPPEPEKPPAASPVKPIPVRPRLVKTPSDSFWDE